MTANQIHSMQRILTDKITKAVTPSSLQIIDKSGGCGSFFEIHVVSSSFQNHTKIKQQQMVYNAIKEEMKEIHGVNLFTSTQ